MKTLIFSLALGLSFMIPPIAQSHTIPLPLLEFMAQNPDATNQEMEAFLEVSGLQDLGAEMWTDDDNPESFNVPPQLVQFLLDNPAANEPEILLFIEQDPELSQSDWAEHIKTLSQGEGFVGDSPFSLNDLVLLNDLGQTFDGVYGEPVNSSQRTEDSRGPLNWGQFAKNYIILGFEHILAGLDHILFVISLVLLLPPWRRILALVTTFTVAHSLTLILGGTKLLTLSSSVVEPLIAASIAYVAITTVFLGTRYPWLKHAQARLGVVFLFGLFHGLGFAGVFEAVAPERSQLLPSLLFFNIGVELGQIMVLLVFVPFLWSLKHFKIDRYVVPVLAVLISTLALWWLGVRLFL